MTKYMVTRTSEMLIDLGEFTDDLEEALTDEEHAVAIAVAMNQWETVGVQADVVPTRLRLA